MDQIVMKTAEEGQVLRFIRATVAHRPKVVNMKPPSLQAALTLLIDERALAPGAKKDLMFFGGFEFHPLRDFV